MNTHVRQRIRTWLQSGHKTDSTQLTVEKKRSNQIDHAINSGHSGRTGPMDGNGQAAGRSKPEPRGEITAGLIQLLPNKPNRRDVDVNGEKWKDTPFFWVGCSPVHFRAQPTVDACAEDAVVVFAFPSISVLGDVRRERAESGRVP